MHLAVPLSRSSSPGARRRACGRWPRHAPATAQALQVGQGPSSKRPIPAAADTLHVQQPLWVQDVKQGLPEPTHTLPCSGARVCGLGRQLWRPAASHAAAAAHQQPWLRLRHAPAGGEWRPSAAHPAAHGPAHGIRQHAAAAGTQRRRWHRPSAGGSHATPFWSRQACICSP